MTDPGGFRVRQRIGPSIRNGPGFCPKINTTAHGTTEILVPSGTKRNIKVKVENIAVSVGSDGSLKVTGTGRQMVGGSGFVWFVGTCKLSQTIPTLC